MLSPEAADIVGILAATVVGIGIVSLLIWASQPDN